MKLLRRQFLQLAGAAGAAAAAPALPQLARAQTYPARPVTIIVGFPVGGGIDIDARLVGKWLSDRLGQPFNVENRTGSGSNIATEAVIRAPADGYTLLLATGANALSPALYPNLNFNFIRDITPVAGIAFIPIVMVVSPSSPLKTVADFVAYAKAHPRETTIGTTLAYPVCCQSCYRVSPLAAVECLVGRCRGMCRNSQDRVECRHWIETPVEAKHKFVEVSL